MPCDNSKYQEERQQTRIGQTKRPAEPTSSTVPISPVLQLIGYVTDSISMYDWSMITANWNLPFRLLAENNKFYLLCICSREAKLTLCLKLLETTLRYTYDVMHIWCPGLPRCQDLLLTAIDNNEMRIMRVAETARRDFTG